MTENLYGFVGRASGHLKNMVELCTEVVNEAI